MSSDVTFTSLSGESVNIIEDIQNIKKLLSEEKCKQMAENFHSFLNPGEKMDDDPAKFFSSLPKETQSIDVQKLEAGVMGMFKENPAVVDAVCNFIFSLGGAAVKMTEEEKLAFKENLKSGLLPPRKLNIG